MRVSAPSLRLATALGLVLPLLSLPASADPGAWVDPPKPAAAAKPKPAEAPAPSTIKETAKEPAKGSVKEPVKAAEAPQPTPSARTAPKAERPETMAAASPRRHHARRTRLADTPAMGPAPSAPGPAPAGRVEAAQALATDYLSAVSAPGEAMVGATQRFYGARVRFYGRPTTLAGLIDEKRGFVRRWPERRYAARAFSTQCSPDGSSCIVRALVDFRAANPQRGAISRGASELVLQVSFAGQHPVIVAESGRVLRRDQGGQDRAETLAPSAGRG